MWQRYRLTIPRVGVGVMVWVRVWAGVRVGVGI